MCAVPKCQFGTAPNTAQGGAVSARTGLLYRVSLGREREGRVAMAQPRPTPGHHGGSGFDPLHYSPHPEWDPPPEEEERGGWGDLIGPLIFVGFAWAVTHFMGADDED